MNGEEIRIAKMLDDILVQNDFIKSLSKSSVSDYIKVDDSKFIRLFQSNSKLGVDFLTSHLNDSKSYSILNTYLFNNRGYLESSYKLNIDIEFENNLVKQYTKKEPDFESGSELEEIRNIASSNAEKYKEENEKLLLKWEKKNKGISGLFRKIFKLNLKPLELEEPTEEDEKLQKLISTIIDKQLSLIN